MRRFCRERVSIELKMKFHRCGRTAAGNTQRDG